MKREPNAASSLTRVRRLRSALPRAVRRPGDEGPGKERRRIGPEEQPGDRDAGQQGVGEGVAHQGEPAQDEDRARGGRRSKLRSSAEQSPRRMNS